MNYATITSRKAQDHYNGIKVEHSDLMQRMQDQQLRVDAFNQQRTVEAQAMQQQDKQNQLEQQKLSQQRDIETKKMAQEGEFRQQDYDIKLLDALKT